MSAEVRMIVQTIAGVVEGSWERLDARDRDAFRAGVEAAVTKGECVALATPAGPTVIPAAAVAWIRFETNDGSGPARSDTP